MPGNLIVLAQILLIAFAAAAGAGGAWWIRSQQAEAEISQLKEQAAEAQAQAVAEVMERERVNAQISQKALRQHTQLANRAAASAAAGSTELGMLHTAIEDYRAKLVEANATAASARLSTDLYAELLGSCAKRYFDMAQAADRADIAARTLIQAWPK